MADGPWERDYLGRTPGYLSAMLAMVVLLPIAIMLVACLLERFEARAITADPPARASRADLRTPPRHRA